MSYSNSVYSKAYKILDERHSRALNSLEERKRKIYAEIPRIEAIEHELASCSIKAARAVFAGGDAKELLELLAQQSKNLREETETLLTNAGYDKNALEPAFTCPVCKDSGSIEVDNKTITCECFKELLK